MIFCYDKLVNYIVWAAWLLCPSRIGNGTHLCKRTGIASVLLKLPLIYFQIYQMPLIYLWCVDVHISLFHVVFSSMCYKFSAFCILQFHFIHFLILQNFIDFYSLVLLPFSHFYLWVCELVCIHYNSVGFQEVLVINSHM